MALIKSALELALERTKDIQGDKESLDAKHFREEGMKLAARAGTEAGFDLKTALKPFSAKEAAWVKEGLGSVLMTALGLPANEAALKRLKDFVPLFAALSSNQRQMSGIMEELTNFFDQYLQQRDQMVEAVRKQAEPKLRQKEDALYQQSGRRVRLTVESDPELSKYLNMNLDKLNAQYEQALEGIRAEIQALLA